jgi:signal transduction histidine kinase
MFRILISAYIFLIGAGSLLHPEISHPQYQRSSLVTERATFAKRINRNVMLINVVLVLTSVAALYAVWRIDGLSRSAIGDHARDRLLVQELRLALERAASLDRAFLLVGDLDIAEEYAQVEKSFMATADRLQMRITTPHGRRLLATIVDEKQAHARAVTRLMRMRMADTSLESLADAFADQVQPKTRYLQALLSDLLAHKTVLLNEAERSTLRTASLAWRILLALAIANLLFSMFITRITKSTLSALRRNSEDLVRAVRTRDEFLAIASHELRTPLAVLKLQTQIFQRQLKSRDVVGSDFRHVETYAEQVGRGVDTLTTLVVRMLDIANLTQGQLSLQKEEVNLGELAEGALNQLAPAFSEAGCTVDFQKEQPAVGYWDRSRLEQVVSNLLINVTRHAAGQPTKVTVTAENGMALLMVEDKGAGIAQADQERIFERFQRASLPTDGTGMGLGLAVSREIARAHGGNLRVESAPGEGARFVLELPVGEEG